MDEQLEMSFVDREPDMLETIFNRQRQLMDRFHAIEKANGQLQYETVPVDLHNRHGQARIKDFAWRITEELGEALALLYYSHDFQYRRREFHEEMVDVLHFLVELTILSGMGPEDVVPGPWKESALHILFRDTFPSTLSLSRTRYIAVAIRMMNLLRELARACNLLKNRPWKQTEVETDIQAYRAIIVKVWHAYIELCAQVGLGPKSLAEAYLDKAAINQRRQEEGA